MVLAAFGTLISSLKEYGLLKQLNKKLIDIFLNEWKVEVDTRPSSYIHRIFKTNFEFEHYLTHVPFSLRKYLLKFRTLNHKLPVET